MVTHPRKSELVNLTRQEPSDPSTLKALRGRPSDYKPEYCELVCEELAKGYSLGGFAGLIGVARSTINDWINRYPDFAEACARASGNRQRHWEGKAIEVGETGGKGSQGQMVIFALTNVGREDWKNRQDIEVSGQVTLASIVANSLKEIEQRTIDLKANNPATPDVYTPADDSEADAPGDDLFDL